MRLNYVNLGHIFLYLHVVTISWSAVARLSDWTPLPLIFLGLAVLSALIRFLFEVNASAKPLLGRGYKIDYLILIAFCLMCLNVIYNPTFKSGNYLLAYGVVFGMYLAYSAAGVNKVSTNEILKYNYYGINFICSFLFLEVIARSVLGIDIFEWIPRTKEATALVTPGLFRAYGLSTEPTQVGNYFACFLPYAAFYRSRMAHKSTLMYSIFLVVAAMLTFSAALAAVMFSGVLIGLVITKQKTTMIKWIVLVGIALAVGVALLVYFLGIGDLLYLAYDKVAGKLAISADGGSSVGSRMASLGDGVAMIIDNPGLGAGLGYAASLGQDSSINFYIFLASEAGLFILVLFLFWFVFHFINAVLNYRKTGNDIFLYCAISLYSGIAYLFFLSTFQNLYLLTSILFYRIILQNITESKRR